MHPFAHDEARTQRLALTIWLALMLATGCVAVAAVQASWFGSVELHVYGFFLGTLFGQAALAATWTAIGPLPLSVRLPICLVWMALLVLALIANHAIAGGSVAQMAVLSGWLLLQWLLIQFPLWVLHVGRYRIRHLDDGPAAVSESQFGLGRLLALTALVAVGLGGVRAVLVVLDSDELDQMQQHGPLFAATLVAHTYLTVPLIVALLQPRYALVATLAALAIVGLITTFETPLLTYLAAAPGALVPSMIWAKNVVQALWIVAALLFVRFMGFRILRSRRDITKP
jgi:hypothetical protein